MSDSPIDSTNPDQPEPQETSQPNGNGRGRGRGRNAGQWQQPQQSADPRVDPANALGREENQSIFEYFQGMTGGAPILLKVTRLYPKIYKGIPCDGMVCEVPELLSEEDIRDRYGGGTYTLQARKQQNNKWIYAGQRQIKIPGWPKVDELMDEPAPLAPTPLGVHHEDSSTVKAAMSMVARTADEERRRADELLTELRDNRSQGMDVDAIARIQAQASKPFELHIQQLQHQNSEMGRQLSELTSQLHNKKTDPLVEKLLLDDNSRLAAVREQHASELRMVTERHRAEVDRMEARADRALDQARNDSNQAMESVKRSYESQLLSVKGSFENQLTIYKMENERLVREVGEIKAELKELRDKKDKPLQEQIAEFAAMKDALAVLSGTGNEDSSPGIMERVMEVVGPLAAGAGARLAGMPGAAAAAAAGGAPVFVPNPGAPPQQQGQPQAPARPAPQISPADIQVAVSFMESAIINNTPPEDFAQSIQTQLPVAIIRQIKAVGVDKWLAQVAGIGDTSASPIATQNGKLWVRKVAKILTGSLSE